MGLISRVSSRTYSVLEVIEVLVLVMKTLLFALAAMTGLCIGADQLRIGKLKKVQCKRTSRGGDELHMHYRGTLKEGGKEFDSSYKRGDPFTFTLGGGDRGAGADIPGGAWLVFEVELLKIKDKQGN